MAQRLRASSEYEIGNSFSNVAIGRVDRLHAGAAIDLHGEAGHRLTHAEPQRGDPRRVHLVSDDVDAAEDDLIKRIRRERLACQQGPPALNGKIDRRERARPDPRLEEGRPASIDDVDRQVQLAAVDCFVQLANVAMSKVGFFLIGERVSAAKSSTATTFATASS